MKKKYKLIKSDSIVVDNKILYRIKALKDFLNVKKGELGGYIQSEYNLSQEDDCWVYNKAKVFDYACVFDNAQVFDNAEVSGKARVYDDARVYGSAKVCGYAKVSGYARVYDNAEVSGNAQVYGDARVCGDAKAFGSAQVFGGAQVYGNARVCGDARVFNGDYMDCLNNKPTKIKSPTLKNNSTKISCKCGREIIVSGENLSIKI